MPEDREKITVRVDSEVKDWLTNEFFHGHHGSVQWFLEEVILTTKRMHEEGKIEKPFDFVENVLSDVYRRNL